MKSPKLKFVRSFSSLRTTDVRRVGGKNASLGELRRLLGNKVPDGFAVTADAFLFFLEANKLRRPILTRIRSINWKSIQSVQRASADVQHMIMRAPIPEALERDIQSAYRVLCRRTGAAHDGVAVRSSATAEDLPAASFAGQLESYLNVRGEAALLRALKNCYASLFGARTISYVHDQGFSYRNIALSVGVQQMARSDQGSAGVMFTLDTESGFDKVVLINAGYGLGELVVKGKIVPDQYHVFKPTMAVISKCAGSKKSKMIYAAGGKTAVRGVVARDQATYVLADREIIQLARWAVQIEKYYRMPMDIEWARDGRGKFWIVQARPETVKRGVAQTVYEEYRLKKTGRALVQGESIGSKIGQGRAQVINSVKEIGKFRPGNVLVTRMTDPDWEPVMKTAAAIVTESGGRTCHAAIVSRELGVPCIVGAVHARAAVRGQRAVTVDCSRGERGTVYAGTLPFEVQRTPLTSLRQPRRPKIMMNLGDPDAAFKFAALPHAGVGLARLEFIITSSVQIHPLALIGYPNIPDPGAKRAIARITAGYTDKKEFFIDQLAFGVAKIAAACWPHDVIVRFSDFKTNEYRSLIGGHVYEPEEANPMIGWRGASRYYDPTFRPAFDLECAAMKKVRDGMGLTNVKVMVPFCRTPEEGKKVISILSRNGLVQGKNGLEAYVMIEIPSNVLLAKEFAEIFDGFSIGSNDLTQLTYGLDRDSELIAHIADERHAAVKKLITQVISVARSRGVKIGLCGQAPSDYPDYAKFLASAGIDSISVTPDSLIRTLRTMRR